nr:hypothetical protein [Tanacetum cinerariifolium]
MLPKFSQIVNRLYAFIYETNHSKSGLGLPSIVALVMVIDKSWTSLGKHEKAFYTSLKKFIDDYKPLVDSAGNIRCPCKSCRLVLWVSIKQLSDHISKYGFDPSYKTWIHHGEADLPSPPPVIDNTRQPQMSDTTACLNELSYIPLNNEQNKTTQGYIGETSNDPTQAKRNEFEKLYSSANEELYPDCDYVTRLDFMAKFTYFKAKGKLTDSIFNEILEFFQNVFPTAKGYKLPPSYYAIKKTFKTTGLGYKSIHACVNDCFLFQGDANKDVHFCPSSHTAKEMTWHATGKCTEPEPRNVRLGLAADGFNLFGNLSQSYSMWPVIITTYNLPPWLCMKESFFMLTLLIPSPKSTGKDIDVYLRPLIDNLKVLWAKPGVETIDVATGLKFNMKAMTPLRHDKTWKGWAFEVALDVAKPLIKLCLFFKQICSQTLMVDDMLKAQSKAIFGGPIHPRWMYPFERYMKKLKNYVRNNAKPEGSIAEGYVAEEALTFSSHYFRDVTTKFNRLDHNVDFPPSTCQLQVFKSLCKSIGLRSVIRIDHQELKKVIWYVLHNSPEIDTYRAKFKILFPNKDMKEEFSDWFGSQICQRHVDNDKDPEVSTTSELFALACGPTWTPISINPCVVDGVRYVVHSRDERRTTQNSDICSPGPNGEMYYSKLQEILEFNYLLFKVVLFRVKCFDTQNQGRKVKWLVLRNNMTQIFTREDDPDIIHFDNSSDLLLSTSLNDLDKATLHIDGQSTEVDAPPDIIDVVDEDDDIIDDEDALPHDLADTDDEDHINVDDDGVDKVYSSEEQIDLEL